MSTDVADLVGFLNSASPDELAQLRSDFPGARVLNVGAVPLGDAGDQPLRVALSRRALRSARRVGENSVRTIRERIRTSKTWQGTSEILAALGSATTVGTLLGGVETAAQIAAAITLISSISALGSRLVQEAAVAGGSRPLQVLFEELATAVVAAELLDVELAFWEGKALPTEREAALIKEVNALVTRVRGVTDLVL